MFSVAELKAKAGKAKDASVTKYNETRDRYQSVPTAKTNYDPDWKKKPPPPPPSRSSNASPRASSSEPPPRPPTRAPPIRASTRPDLVASPSHPPPRYEEAVEEGGDEPIIQWSKLSPEDKQVFFSWLDEFFARHFSVPVPPRSTTGTIKPASPPSGPPPPASRGPPPKVNARSRPPMSSTPSSSSTTSNDFVLSHPAPTVHGSAALDLANYFHPSTHWDSAWYNNMESPIPPPLKGSTQMTFAAGWATHGRTKTLFAGVLFADLSICWFSVVFPDNSNLDPNDTSSIVRSAQYLPCPSPMGKAALIEAHETYGETIAAFAESFDGTGEFCARGECWDLAHEALQYFDAYDYVPKPIPSLSRTHGHLIFEGKAMGKGKMVGRWRGGDDRVRRGDIVEWRKVKINIVGASPYSWALLGDPDHTAVIVRDSVPSRQPADGQPLSPAELGSIEVVEQSVKSPPCRKDYDMNAFEEGEVWIYRPVSMQAYLGIPSLAGKCPEDVSAQSI